MAKLDLYLLGSTFFLALAVATGGMIWLGRIVPRSIEKKYSWIVRLKGKFPFFRDWEKEIDAEDILAFRRHRKAFKAYCVCGAFVIVLMILALIHMIWGLSAELG